MWRSMLCQSEEQAVGILHWRARVYMGKAIHHAQANFMASQVRGAVPEPPAVRQAQQYARTKVLGARGAPAVMGAVPYTHLTPPTTPLFSIPP